MKQKNSSYKFLIVVERDEGVFVASCPGISGVYEEGDTVEEAVKLAAESAVQTINTRKSSNTLPTSNEFFQVVTSEVLLPEFHQDKCDESKYIQAYYPQREVAFC